MLCLGRRLISGNGFTLVVWPWGKIQSRYENRAENTHTGIRSVGRFSNLCKQQKTASVKCCQSEHCQRKQPARVEKVRMKIANTEEMFHSKLVFSIWGWDSMWSCMELKQGRLKCPVIDEQMT